jgi:acylphosphatase
MPAVRLDVVFTGRVQGVGFRQTTVQVAGDFDVTGWVRNEPDGSVRCIVEGDLGEINRFIKAVQGVMAGNIRGTTAVQVAATGEFAGFGVRR